MVHAALFGSVARDEARADSDIDIMIDIDPQTGDGMSIYDYVNLKRFIGDFFEGPVDVIDSQGLRPLVKPSVMADAIYAF